MTDAGGAGDVRRTGGLPAAARRIRRLSPPQAPWSGWLAQIDETAFLLVPVAELAGLWTWRASSDGHVAAPRDLVCEPEGHLAVLPVCAERVDVFLARRLAAGIPLSRGETVTLAVSVLRGTVEALEVAGTNAGAAEWWLGEDGRPLLVGRGGAGPSAPEAADEILRLLGDVAGTDAPLVHAVEAAHVLVGDARRLRAGTDEVESGLFALAPAEPLATAVLARRSAPPAVDAHRDRGDADPAPRASWWQALVPHIDRPLSELVSTVTMALWRRLRADRPVRRRRRPMLVAAVAGAIALAVGLLWTQSGEPPAAAENGTTPRTATASAAPDATGMPPKAGRSGDGDDIVSVVDALLRARRACADQACRARTQEHVAAALAGGAVELPATSRTLTLLDEFGGAAVLRVHARTGTVPDQLVVVVREDDSWLLRDVRDVAQQP